MALYDKICNCIQKNLKNDNLEINEEQEKRLHKE